jgi:hypothetical protein
MIGKLWEILLGIVRWVMAFFKNYYKRRDLIIFLKKWFSDASNLNVSSGRLNINLEKEFGSYRLNKLIAPLKALRVCTLSPGASYWFFVNIHHNYNDADVKNLISDVKRGRYDQYLS